MLICVQMRDATSQETASHISCDAAQRAAIFRTKCRKAAINI